MLQQALCASALPLFYLMFSFSSVPGANSFIYAVCSRVYFNSMTPYESNVNSLFTSLVNSASASNLFSECEISSPPPASPQRAVVYGFFQCQGDLSYSNCQSCVASSVIQLKKTCPLSTGGTIQLEEGCFVKYDNASFFGVEDKTEVWKGCGPPIAYNSVASSNIDAVLGELVTGNGQYFRMGASGSVQGVAQCVQDLSVRECEDCVLEARARLGSECGMTLSGDMFLGKCYIRYVDHGFQPRNGMGNNNDIISNQDGQKSKSIIRDVGIILATMFGVGTIGVTVTHAYTINVVQKTNTQINITMERLKEVDQKAEAARMKAKEAKRKAKEASAARSMPI